MMTLSEFRRELSFANSKLEAAPEEMRSFLKRISNQIHRMESHVANYEGGEDVKTILQFYWSVLAGFSFISGYSNIDQIRRKLCNI